jgi:hypothetical protein
MTSLVSTFAKVVPVIGSNVLANGTDESPIYIDLTENAAMEDLYIHHGTDTCRVQTLLHLLLVAPKWPTCMSCTNAADRHHSSAFVCLEAPGQVLIDVPARYLQDFGKQQDGVQRHAGTSLESEVAAHVYKIELGFDDLPLVAASSLPYVDRGSTCPDSGNHLPWLSEIIRTSAISSSRSYFVNNR